MDFLRPSFQDNMFFQTVWTTGVEEFVNFVEVRNADAFAKFVSVGY